MDRMTDLLTDSSINDVETFFPRVRLPVSPPPPPQLTTHPGQEQADHREGTCAGSQALGNEPT